MATDKSLKHYNKADESEIYILEWYKDSDAALFHMKLVNEAISQLLQMSQILRFEIFGDTSENLVEALTPLGAQFFKHWKGFTH